MGNDPSNKPIKIVQISDVHLQKDPEDELLGVPMEKSFSAVIELLKKNNEEMDLILLTGDISQDGSDEAYIRVAEKLKEFEVPIYWVPGNHDDNHVMSRVYPLENISNKKHIVLKTWQLILLNSQIPEQVPGRLNAEQLKYLKECLEAYPEHDAVIILHHHPVPMGVVWLDPIGLTNAEEFWETIKPFHNVRSVVFGHVHQESSQMRGKICCYSVPSTCIQFKPSVKEFALDHKNPGYRWIHLYDDGRMETAVVRTKEYVGKFHTEATGY